MPRQCSGSIVYLICHGNEDYTWFANTVSGTRQADVTILCILVAAIIILFFILITLNFYLIIRVKVYVLNISKNCKIWDNYLRQQSCYNNVYISWQTHLIECDNNKHTVSLSLKASQTTTNNTCWFKTWHVSHFFQVGFLLCRVVGEEFGGLELCRGLSPHMFKEKLIRNSFGKIWNKHWRNNTLFFNVSLLWVIFYHKHRALL